MVVSYLNSLKMVHNRQINIFLKFFKKLLNYFLFLPLSNKSNNIWLQADHWHNMDNKSDSLTVNKLIENR